MKVERIDKHGIVLERKEMYVDKYSEEDALLFVEKYKKINTIPIPEVTSDNIDDLTLRFYKLTPIYEFELMKRIIEVEKIFISKGINISISAFDEKIEIDLEIDGKRYFDCVEIEGLSTEYGYSQIIKGD